MNDNSKKNISNKKRSVNSTSNINKKRISPKKENIINEESVKIENELDKIQNMDFDKELPELKEININHIDFDEDNNKNIYKELDEAEKEYTKDFTFINEPEEIDKDENDIEATIVLDELNEKKELLKNIEEDTDILDDLPKKVEEENKEINKTKEKGNILSFIIALIIVAILGTIVYFYFIKIDTSNDNIEEIKLNDSQINELGKIKFQFLNSKHNVKNSYPIFFQENDITVQNITTNDILSIAYNLLSVEDKNIEGSETDNCYLEENDINIENYPSNCHKEIIDTNVLKEQLDLYFSNTLKIDYSEFTPTGSLYCKVIDNKYNCYLKHNELESTNLQILTSYGNSIMEDDNLIVYSYLLTVKRDLYSYGTLEKGIYNDINATEKIDDLKYYEEVMQRGLNEETTHKLIEHYKDKITKYKSIFKKENGNYVWQGTYIDEQKH